MVATYHKQYVPAYLRWLQQGKQGSGDPTIDRLDGKLDEAVVMLFRRMAHAKLKALRAKAAAVAAKQQPQQQQTWLGWLMGAPPPKPAPPPAQAHAAEGGGEAPGGGEGELDTSMGVEEWNKLEEVLAEQAVRAVEGASRQEWVWGGMDVWCCSPASRCTQPSSAQATVANTDAMRTGRVEHC